MSVYAFSVTVIAIRKEGLGKYVLARYENA